MDVREVKRSEQMAQSTLHGSEMLAIATRTTRTRCVAKRSANRQNGYSRRRMLRRYGVT
jgi:hypothetical protein